MARHPNPALVGHSIHGQSQAALLLLHQQSLEKTINSVMTVIDSDDDHKKGRCQRKKKKYYPWIQRDSQNQRNKIGQEGSRRRQRHDNDKFVHHPCAVLYQVDLAFPGYDRDAPSFHWKYDSVIDSLINNNPPSSRRSKPTSAGLQDKTPAPEPKMGHRLLTRAQRKDIKKVHVPKGVVMQYEGELVNFLDQLTLETKDDDVDNENDSPLSDSVIVVTDDNGDKTVVDSSNWVLVQSSDLPAEESSPAEATATSSSEDEQQPKQQQQQQDSDKLPQIYLRWDIQDQFLRFVAHALCAFYGLVSFSKTALDGKRHVYICHPTHLNSISQLATSEESVVTSEPSSDAAVPSRPKLPKRQSTLEHVQELPLHELDQLWKKVEPVKLPECPRPDITFFEYLYPSTRPMF